MWCVSFLSSINRSWDQNQQNLVPFFLSVSYLEGKNDREETL